MTIIFNPVHFENYTLVKKIGEGSFAVVYEAIHIRTHQKVALKIVSKSKLQESDNLTLFKREVQIAKKAHHPFVVSFYDLIENSTHVAIAMEYVSGPSLLDYINALSEMSVETARTFLQQIVIALKYLHVEMPKIFY